MPIIEERVTNSDGEIVTIYIEVDNALPLDPYNPYTDVRGEGTKVIEAARDVFASGMSLIRTCADQIVQTVQKVDQGVRPTEFEVQLAIKLDSQVGAILAKASGEAQLQVTMKWVKKEKEQA